MRVVPVVVVPAVVPAVVRAALVGAVLAAAPAVADIAPGVSPVGPGFAPPEANAAAQKIAMKDEVVVLDAYDTDAGAFVVVDATFTMAGPAGSKTPLAIVFPGAGVMVGDSFTTHPPLTGFQAFVDGKPVATKEEPKTFTSKAGPPGREYTRSRTETWHGFAATVDDETVIRVRYAVPAESYGDPETGAGPHARAQYILHTGAAWAGPIGKATVEVRGHGVDVAKTSLRTFAMASVSLVSLNSKEAPPAVAPAGATRTPTSLVFVQQNLEPTGNDDVEVVFPTVKAKGGSGYVDDALAAAMVAAVRAR